MLCDGQDNNRSPQRLDTQTQFVTAYSAIVLQLHCHFCDTIYLCIKNKIIYVLSCIVHCNMNSDGDKEKANFITNNFKNTLKYMYTTRLKLVKHFNYSQILPKILKYICNHFEI